MNTVDEASGLSRKQLRQWYSEWKKDDMNRKTVIGAMCDDPPEQGARYRADQIRTVVDALGEGRSGVQFVGIGSEKAAFVYGNGMCLKLQTSDGSTPQTRREIETMERLASGPYSDVVPKIFDRNETCTSLLCEACGVCDDAAWKKMFGTDRWQSYLFMHVVLSNFRGFRPSDIFWNSKMSLDEMNSWIDVEQDCWEDSAGVREAMYGILTSKTAEGIHLLKLMNVLKAYEISDWATDGNIGIARRNGQKLPVIVDLGL